MSAGDFAAYAAVLVTASLGGWQQYRDVRKDRREALARAVEAAREAAVLEERVRRLEGRPADDE